MTQNQKIIAWVSIVGTSVTTGLTTAIKFFPDITAILTAGAGLIGAVVAFLVTRKSDA